MNTQRKKPVKKVTYCVIPIIWYLGKDETIGAKRLVATSLATMNRQSSEDFQGSKIVLQNTIMVDTGHYAFLKTHRIVQYKE